MLETYPQNTNEVLSDFAADIEELLSELPEVTNGIGIRNVWIETNNTTETDRYHVGRRTYPTGRVEYSISLWKSPDQEDDIHANSVHWDGVKTKASTSKIHGSRLHSSHFGPGDEHSVTNDVSADDLELMEAVITHLLTCNDEEVLVNGTRYTR
jgi:hypothetical protein